MRNFVFIIILILLTVRLFADTIILKDGRVLQGKIINQTQTRVEIQTEDGRRIVLNKEEIRRIQFGPTNKEIEERKRQEELRKKQEEEKRLEELKRKEEERRLEELKKQEQRRKQQEQTKVPKKPIIERNYLEIGYGIGPSYSIPSFIKVHNIFLFANNIGGNLVGPPNGSPIYRIEENNFQKNHINSHLYINYFYNNWSFGLDITTILFNELIESNRYTISQGNLNLSLVQMNFEKDPEYSYSYLWIKYDWYRTNYRNLYILLGIKGGIYSVYTQISYDKKLIDIFNFFQEYNQEYNFEKGNIHSLENDLLFLGPSVHINLSDNGTLQFDINYINGNFKGNYKYQKFGADLVDVNLFYSGSVEGGSFELQYKKRIQGEVLFFTKYLFNELTYREFFLKRPRKNKGDAIVISNDQSQPVRYLPGGLIDLLSFGQTKKAIEKNQSLSFGVSLLIQIR